MVLSAPNEIVRIEDSGAITGLQLVSYVKFKVKAGSGGVVLGPMKYLYRYFVELTILHTMKVLDLLESQK